MATKEQLKICLASSEVTPLAKTGGLADVAAALPALLRDGGHDVRVLMPRYARVDQAGTDIETVAGLDDLSMSIGPWNVNYAIDRTTLPGSGLPVYLLRCPELYGRDAVYTNDADEHLRFLLLSRGAIEMCQHMSFAPDILHCHDWHTAMIPLYLRSVYSWDALFTHTKTVLTIHNIGYQGVFGANILPDLDLGDSVSLLHQDDLEAGQINFLKTGVLFAQLLTTVSPTYAREIQGPKIGMGLDDLLRQRSDSVLGILNGVDYAEWNPESDALIPANYSSENLSGKIECKRALMTELALAGGDRQPLIGIVSRLVGQKGIDLLERTLPALLERHNFSLAVLGSGERRFEEFFERLQRHFRNRVAFYRGYNNRLAHWIEAGADMFLMPSLYEPCGLNQMYSLRYGTIPIVRETGGLADSVNAVDRAAGTGTGILFRDYDEPALHWAVGTALELYADRTLWTKIVQNGMAMDFSWDRQAGRYVELFRRLGDPS